MDNLFQYEFVVRGFEAGIMIAILAPLVGIFLVLRRYALIADTLAHVSLAGISFGLLFGIPPIITALGSAVIASLGIDRLRTTKKIYGESALALFLSGSLAIATVLLSIGNGLTANLFSYLFGSIVTVTQSDVIIIFVLSLIVLTTLLVFYKELVYITFDEESARVSGIPVKLLNTIFIILAALAISLAIPIVGALLISALIVIPVVSALQLKKSFATTIIYAEIISLFSVISGIIASFYFSLPTGGTIVLVMLGIFGLILIARRGK